MTCLSFKFTCTSTKDTFNFIGWNFLPGESDEVFVWWRKIRPKNNFARRKFHVTKFRPLRYPLNPLTMKGSTIKVPNCRSKIRIHRKTKITITYFFISIPSSHIMWQLVIVNRADILCICRPQHFVETCLSFPKMLLSKSQKRVNYDSWIESNMIFRGEIFLREWKSNLWLTSLSLHYTMSSFWLPTPPKWMAYISYNTVACTTSKQDE